jgi:hypothetical protein
METILTRRGADFRLSKGGFCLVVDLNPRRLRAVCGLKILILRLCRHEPSHQLVVGKFDGDQNGACSDLGCR